jgi:hypothetical protein
MGTEGKDRSLIIRRTIRSFVIFAMITLYLFIPFSTVERTAEESDGDGYDDKMNATLIPMNGTTFTTFNFTLQINATIDVKGVHLLLANESHNMSKRGDIWIAEIPLENGTYTHRYLVDLDRETVYYPEEGYLEGPNVVHTDYNSPPTLRDGMYTRIGNSTVVQYWVIYSDPDNDRPRYVELFINGTPYNMSRYDGNDYTEGVLYHLTAEIPPGNHSYYFLSSDGYNTTRYPDNGTLEGPDIPIPEPVTPPEDDEVTTRDIVILAAAFLAVILLTGLILYFTFKPSKKT